MITIDKYLERILYDFKEYLDKKPCLCDLKSVNFYSGLVPDYSNIPVQQLYLLRYAFAYAFEYKAMYKSLLERETFPNEISVLSFGCGTNVDYWSLIHSLMEKGLRECVVNYMGIDLIDWEYKFPSRKIDNFSFAKQNGAHWIDRAQTLDFDVYMFPKSISEFTDVDFQTICNNFQNKAIAKEKFHILISLRVDEYSMERDISRTNQLMSAIKQNGYLSEDSYNTYTYFIDDSKGIRHYDCAFVFPNEAIEIIKNLNETCNNFILNGKNCTNDCTKFLNRWPVLKPTTIRFQVISFKRG